MFRESRHMRKSPSSVEDQQDFTPRMANIRTPKRVDYNAELNEQQDGHGFMGKMTSKLGGMFRGVKDVFDSLGAAFKPKEEPKTFKRSLSPVRLPVSNKDMNFSSTRNNNAISSVNFGELSNILKPGLPNESFGGPNSKNLEMSVNNISFGRANLSNSFQAPGNQSRSSSVSQSNSASIKLMVINGLFNFLI